jgi:hypothetical protein
VGGGVDLAKMFGMIPDDHSYAPRFKLVKSKVQRARRKSRPPHGRSAHGRSAHGRSAHGRPAHGRSAHGRPAHGRPAHGRSAHGRSAHGRSAHGRSAHGKTVRFAPSSKRIPSVSVLHRLIREKLGKDCKLEDVRRTTLKQPDHSCHLHILASKAGTFLAFRGRWNMDTNKVSIHSSRTIRVKDLNEWKKLHSMKKSWQHYRSA